jgi:hypothetical protein
MASLAAPEAQEPDDAASTGWQVATAVWLAIGLVLAVAAVAGVFLAPYYSGHYTTPFGFDTPHYIWRSNLVIARGLDGLRSIEAILRISPNVDRPAFPVFAAIAYHVVGVEPLLLAFVVPAVFAAAFGLSAGSFAREVLEEPRWSVPVYVLVAGASLYIARTAVGSLDNLTVDSVLLAGGTATLLCAARRRGGIAAIALFLAGFMIHWIFTVLFMLLIMGVAVVLLPDSYLRWRRGEGLLSLPSLRIGGIVAASTGVGLLGLKLTPEFTTKVPLVALSDIEHKMKQRIPLLKIPLTMGLAALGAVALWWPKSTLRRWGLAMLGLWALSVPAALVYYRIRKHHFPAYRVVEFALAVPILAAALAIGLSRIGRGHGRWRYVGAALSAGAIVVAISATLAAGRDAWEVTPSLGAQIMLPPQSQQIATAADYLRSIDAKGPVVFVTSAGGYVPPDRVIRAGMPGYLVPSIRTFVGRAEDLLAGHPTVSSVPEINGGSKVSWPGVQEVLGQPYIGLYLSTLNGAYPPPAGAREIANGIYLFHGGPPPSGRVAEARKAGIARERLVAGVMLMLGFLMVAGLGWAAGLVEASWLGRVGLAPAFGLASVTLASLPVAFLGTPIGRTAAWAIFLATAAAGWAVFAGITVFRRRPGGRAVEPTAPVMPETAATEPGPETDPGAGPGRES